MKLGISINEKVILHEPLTAKEDHITADGSGTVASELTAIQILRFYWGWGNGYARLSLEGG